MVLRPDAKTSRGILALVVNEVPGRVMCPWPRAVLNSSSLSPLASMTKPRSALVTSSAESITSVSTSSTTAPEPRARKPFSTAAICRRSLTSELVSRQVAELPCSA